nr:piggyBac transposable element-derived protein 1-like [Vanessa tameamea]
MDDRGIEEVLQQLENGELSEDDLESDGEDIPYYTSPEELVRELKKTRSRIVIVIENEAESTLPGTSSQLPDVINSARNLVWKKQSLVFDENKIKFGGSEEFSSDIMELQTPYQFFAYFSTKDLLENIVTETTRYSIQKQPDRPEVVTMSDFHKYLGILIYMSVYYYPSTRSYWSNKFGFSPIKEAMSVNKFERIRMMLHFNNNENHLPVSQTYHDKLHKLRPILDQLNRQFSSITIEQRISIHEQMCATKIGHFLKQYLPNKPHKWGFILFVLCNLMGYTYQFQVYAGKETTDRLPNEPEVGVVGETVLKLLRVIPRHQNHIVYFDNYYTSLPIMYTLAKEGVHSLGTIQRNRLGKFCKLPSKQVVTKSSVPRGMFEEYVTFDGVDISSVNWKDNLSVINSWILYKKVAARKGVLQKNVLSLADFRSDLAETLTKYIPSAPRGRSSISSTVNTTEEPKPKIRRGKPCQILPLLEVRMDKIDHNQLRTESREQKYFTMHLRAKGTVLGGHFTNVGSAKLYCYSKRVE